MELGSDPLSPVKHLYLKTQSERDIETSLIGQIVDAVSADHRRLFVISKTFIFPLQCIENNLAVVNAEYLVDREYPKCPRSSIRLTSNRLLTDDDIEFVFKTLENVSNRILA